MKQNYQLCLLLLFLFFPFSLEIYRGKEIVRQRALLKHEVTKKCLSNFAQKVSTIWLKKSHTSSKFSKNKRAFARCFRQINITHLFKAFKNYTKAIKLIYSKRLRSIKYHPYRRILKRLRIVQKRAIILHLLRKVSTVFLGCKAIPKTLKLAISNKYKKLKKSRTKIYKGHFIYLKTLKFLRKFFHTMTPSKYYRKRYNSLRWQEKKKRCLSFQLFNSFFKCRDHHKLIRIFVKYFYARSKGIKKHWKVLKVFKSRSHKKVRISSKISKRVSNKSKK